MPELTPYQKLAANLAYMRKQGASKDDIKAEIGRFQEATSARNKAERALSKFEKVGAVASKFSSGATFGLLDEAVGIFDEDAKNEQRFLQKQLEEENPMLALGAEIGGALAVPIPFLKGAPRAASRWVKAGRVVGEGAIQGGLSALGNAEGNLLERVDDTAKGVTLGSATAGAIGGTGKAASALYRGAGKRANLTSPTLEEIADKMPEPDLASARTRLGELSGRRLGDETMVADVLPQGEGSLRQAATANRSVRKDVDTELKGRVNRLANLGDDRFSEYTGTQRQSARKSVEELNDEAGTRARPHYQAAEQQAASFKSVASGLPDEAVMTMGGKPVGTVKEFRLKMEEATALPFVRQRTEQLRKLPRSTFVNLADDDHALLDKVYKDIGKEIRSPKAAQDWSYKEDLIQQRAVLADALTKRSPSYRPALNEFADGSGRREAYELGSERAPADLIPSQRKGLDAGEDAMFREGKAQALRRDVPNLDIGEMARFQDVLGPISTREKADVFKATFGEPAYKEYVKDLLEMAGLQRMRAGAHESTTVDKLMEQLQGDPQAIVGMVQSALSGNPISAISQAGRAMPLDRLRNSKQAQDNASFLMQRGEDKVKAALDHIEKLRKEGRLPRPRNWRRPEAPATAARVAGGVVGRP